MNYSYKAQNKDVSDQQIVRQIVLSSFMKAVGLYLVKQSGNSPINEAIAGEHHLLLI